MRLWSIDLGKRRGTFEIQGVVDVPKKYVKFQALANGLVFCESEFYDVLREFVMEAISLNSPNKEGMN